MNAKLYYFSGTGNSYAICKRLGEALDCEMFGMTDAIPDPIGDGVAAVGLVFPVNYGDIPNRVDRFIRTRQWNGTEYIFAVASYGGGPGIAFKRVGRCLGLSGTRLAAGFGIHMPQNAFYKRFENIPRVLAGMERAIPEIQKRVARRYRGIHTNSSVQYWIEKPLLPLLQRMTNKYLEKSTGIRHDRQAQIAQLDQHFTTSSDCTGCGMCELNCPVGNIRMENNRPVWLHRCENCIACFNACPNKAISTRLVAKDYRYTHPEYHWKTRK